MSSIDSAGETEHLVDLCFHTLLVLVEYKPPTLENFKYLIKGGHLSLSLIYRSLKDYDKERFPPDETEVDLTNNEYYRLFKVRNDSSCVTSDRFCTGKST